MDLVEFGWIQLNLVEFRWIRFDSVEFGWIRLNLNEFRIWNLVRLGWMWLDLI